MKSKLASSLAPGAALLLALTTHPLLCGAASNAAGLRKITDLVVYRDDAFYSAFPSVVRRPDGELLVAFRRAPERRRLGEPRVSHTDPN
ncbi:MAG: hypothetical protein RMK20_14625, partial [Verrucomicrobiales bacterium]|nr:hypothetical protein [Verrucomicrobiales bacterium]